MSDTAFSHLVDEYQAAGYDLGDAISLAADDAAHHVDSFTRLRQEALDNGARLL